MEFLLGLGTEEKRRRIARHRRLRRWFWALGVLVLGVQIAAIKLAPAQTQVRSTPLALEVQPTQLPTTIPLAPQKQVVMPTATARNTPTPIVAPPSPTLGPATGHGGPNPTAIPSRPPLATDHKPPNERAIPLSLDAPPTWISEQRFVLEGRGTPGEVVSVSYRHSLIAQAEIDAQGHWQVAAPTAPLRRGENTFQIISGRTAQVAIDAQAPLSVTLTFAPWWLEAPPRLQGSLGQGYACAPTVLGMAMDFFNHQNPRYPAPATTTLVKGLKAQGFLPGYGADAQMLCDLAIAYGYSHSTFYEAWTQAHLRQSLDAGHPVIANVRVGMSTNGYGHSVLVIGLSPDGKRVMVNDPVRGMVEYPWATFDRSWGSFGPPYRHGAVIRP
jgi:hypothetical protein